MKKLLLLILVSTAFSCSSKSGRMALKTTECSHNLNDSHTIIFHNGHEYIATHHGGLLHEEECMLRDNL